MKLYYKNIHKFTYKLLLVVFLGISLFLLISCQKNSEETISSSDMSSKETNNTTAEQIYRRVNIVIATVDLAIGRNRLTFGIIDSDQSPLRVKNVNTDYLFMDAPKIEVSVEGEAEYVQWPVSKSGVYVSRVNFENPGIWMLRIRGVDNEGNQFFGEAKFNVKLNSFSPAIDSKVPKSINKTLNDVENIAEISSSTDPDLNLYEITVLDAINNDLPTLIVFATPKFCMTQTCGPQVSIISNLRKKYVDQVNFIHIEIYDNLNEIGGDIQKAKISPIVMEWGIVSEPYTFIIKRNGLLHSKFEGYTSEDELSDAISRVLLFKK